MPAFDIAIVGAGIMGAATACEVARNGARLALIDQAKPPNPRAASVDHSKVFRFAYPDSMYARLAVDALAGWRSLERETGMALLLPSGVLMIGKAASTVELDTARALASLGLEAELMSSAETAARFPQFNPKAFDQAVFDPSGAVANAEAAVEAFIGLARQRNVKIVGDSRIIAVESAAGGRVKLSIDGAEPIVCQRALIAAGPWTRSLIPSVATRLTTTRQEVVYLEPSVDRQSFFAPSRFPLFLDSGSGFYGFPIHHAGCVKIANHLKGVPADITSAAEADSVVGPDFIARCRDFFAEFIPALAAAEVRETKICFYNNTPDDDFIIDWHPEIENVLLATGFSGHGFKFAPAIGRICAALLTGGKAPFDLARFRLARFG